MKQVHEMGVAELGRALAARQLSSVEAADALLRLQRLHIPVANLAVVDGEGLLHRLPHRRNRKQRDQRYGNTE